MGDHPLPPNNSLKLTRRAGPWGCLPCPLARPAILGSLPASAERLSSRPLCGATRLRPKRESVGSGRCQSHFALSDLTTPSSALALSSASPRCFRSDFKLREAEHEADSTDSLSSPERGFPPRDSLSVQFTGTNAATYPLRAIALRMTVPDRKGNYLLSGEVGVLGDPPPAVTNPSSPGTPSTILQRSSWLMPSRVNP